MNKIAIDRILKCVNGMKNKGPYIKIVECQSLYIVSTSDDLEPILFTKDGILTMVNYVELKREQLKNPKLVYES